MNTVGEVLPVEFWTEAIISFMTKSMDCKPGLAHLQAAALKSLVTWSDFLRFAAQGQCILSSSVGLPSGSVLVLDARIIGRDHRFSLGLIYGLRFIGLIVFVGFGR